MIALHARTLKQGYSGKANWEWIKELKESVSIPVIGNGDVNTPEDAEKMIKETGCDYVMIGRASIGNPFIFKQCNDYFKNGKYEVLNDKKKIDYFFKYLEYAKEFDVSFSKIKVHAMWRTKGMIGGAGLRREISQVKNLDELKKIFHKLY